MFKKFSPDKVKIKLTFIGYWIGFLCPEDSIDIISFYSCISGYILILVLLIFEKKLIFYVDEVENTFNFNEPADNKMNEENDILKQIIE